MEEEWPLDKLSWRLRPWSFMARRWPLLVDCIDADGLRNERGEEFTASDCLWDQRGLAKPPIALDFLEMMALGSEFGIRKLAVHRKHRIGLVR